MEQVRCYRNGFVSFEEVGMTADMQGRFNMHQIRTGYIQRLLDHQKTGKL